MTKLTLFISAFVLFAFSQPTIAAISLAAKQAVVVDIKQNTGAEYAVTVHLGKQGFRFITLIPDYESDPASIVRQRSLTGWKGDFLFVRQQCSSQRVWRCVVDQIFTRRSNMLMHIGSVESRDCSMAGCRFDETSAIFTDIYDGLETNPVSGQVDTPPLQIVRRLVNGKLVSDLNMSWELNAQTYAASIGCLEKVARVGFAEKCDGNLDPWSALTFAAKLTHYTGRSTERTNLFEVLAAGYCAKSADPGCSKRTAGVKDHFSRFPPGDGLRFSSYPVEAINVSVAENNKPTPQKFESGKAIPLKL